MKTDKFKTNPAAKKIREENKRAVKKVVAKITKDITKKEWNMEGAINKINEIGIDNDPGIDVPLHARGLTSKWNFQKTKKRMPWYDKVTWVLTAVNVVILISLVIKNV